jgi:hypothetical protein
MKHLDFDWDIEDWGITFDDELNLAKFGWEDGDYFKFVIIDGKRYLKKVDKLEEFILKGVEDGCSRTN